MILFRERLWPTPWLFIAGLLLVPAVLLMLAPISLPLAIPVSAAVYLMFCFFLFLTSPVITVTEQTLQAGRATISRSFIGSAQVLPEEKTKKVLSTESDARAHLVIRSWVAQSVRVEITDEKDPTPYWLLSSRRAEELAGALTKK